MEKGGSEMKRLAGIRVIGMLAALAAVLALIQGLGGYLVSELTQFETTAPEVGSPAETQTPAVIHRQTLRLETMAYNTLQIGTFTDLAKGQHIIDELAEEGYRVFVTPSEPYHLWVGCFAAPEGMQNIPEVIQAKGEDIYVTKALLNETVLSFDEDQLFFKEHLVPLLEKSDIVLKHSLKMFQTADYQAYDDALWQQQIQRLQEEIEHVHSFTEEVLLEADAQPLAKPLADFQVLLEEYSQSLTIITEKKNDQAVLLAQSYLLELISQYHQLIEDANSCSSGL